MNKKTKRTIVIIIAAVLLTAAAVTIFLIKSGSVGYRSISIAEIFGKVMTENNGKTYEAYKNMRLADGYALTTNSESYTRMILDDDKYVKLEADSHAVFEALGDAKQHKTAIRLDKGALTTEITKPLSETESYVVNTPNAVLAVRGTMFRVEVKQEENGDYYCDVYTFGGTVVSRRIMPDGTLVDEHVEIPAGYKATVKMDEIITVYLEEKIEVKEDNVDPINIPDVRDTTLVDVYNAAYHGHDMFITTSGLWDEILRRNIDLSQYRSLYDGKGIPEMDYGKPNVENSGATSAGESVPESSDSTESSRENSDSSGASVSESSSSAVSSEISRPVSSTTSRGDTHEPTVEPDTSSSASSTAGSGTVSVSPPAVSSESSTSTTSTTSSSTSTTSSSTTTSTTTSVPVTPPIVHTHTPVTTTEAPDCTTAGKRTTICSECGELLSEETLPPRGHSARTTVITEPTCTAEGREETRCADCSALLGIKVIPATGHTRVEEKIEPTCTEDGAEVVSCERCHDEIDRKILPKLGHDYQEEITKEATCTEEGSKHNICSRCHEEEPGSVEVIAKTGHTPDSDTEADGVTTVKCSVCGEIISQTLNGVTYPVEITSTFTDTVFADEVKKNDADGDGKLSLDEARAVTSLDLTDVSVTSLSGIETLPELSALKYTVHVEDGELTLPAVEGISAADISAVTGGTYDETTHNLTAITGGEGVGYTYYNRGKSVTVTLAADDTSTFAAEGVAIDATNFPDAKFREYVSKRFDKNTNGYLSQEECEAVTDIHVNGGPVSDGGISSIKGVENFKNLTVLYCGYNMFLHEVDVSKNLALEVLYLEDLYITSIDVSKNLVLKSLDCESMPITSIDVSNNPLLEYLNCYYTRLAFADLKSNTNLEQAYFFGSKQYVHVENGVFDTSTISGFDKSMVSNVEGANWDPDTGVLSNIVEGTNITYTYDCDGKGGHNETFTLVPDENSTFAPEGVAIDAENFPDAKFREYVTNNFDTDSDGSLSQAECDAVTEIDVGGFYSADGGIASLDGIENFTKLKSLSCDYNSGLTELDVSKNTVLTNLYFADTQITSLDVSKNTALIILNCSYTPIISLDVSKNTALSSLTCVRTQISELDVRNNTALRFLDCEGTPITSLDVSNNMLLASLRCHYTKITSLDVNNNVELEELYCEGTPIASLDISRNTALIRLNCGNMKKITSLDVSKNTVLRQLWCYNTQIPFVDISSCPNLTDFNADFCQYLITTDASEFDTATIEGFDMSRVTNVQNAEISGSKFINITDDVSYTYDCKGTGESDFMKTFTLVRSGASTASLTANDDTAVQTGTGAPTEPPAPPTDGVGEPRNNTTDIALPPEDIEGLRFLPLGILALMRDRRRKTAFRFKRKAEI